MPSNKLPCSLSENKLIPFPPLRRRKPTSLSLPIRFTPVVTSTSPSALGPTDLKLSTSLESLDHLSSSYRTLQSLEHKLDWTFSRKAIELQEPQGQGQGGEERGERRERKLTIWVQAKVFDQEWQLTTQEGELEKTGEVPKDETTQVKVPRVEFEIKGKISDVNLSLSLTLNWIER